MKWVGFLGITVKRVAPFRYFDGHVNGGGSPTVGPISSSARLHIFVLSYNVYMYITEIILNATLNNK